MKMFVRTPLKKTDESRQGKENLLDSTRSDHTLAFTTEHTLPPQRYSVCVNCVMLAQSMRMYEAELYGRKKGGRCGLKNLFPF